MLPQLPYSDLDSKKVRVKAADQQVCGVQVEYEYFEHEYFEYEYFEYEYFEYEYFEYEYFESITGILSANLDSIHPLQTRESFEYEYITFEYEYIEYECRLDPSLLAGRPRMFVPPPPSAERERFWAAQNDFGPKKHPKP